MPEFELIFFIISIVFAISSLIYQLISSIKKSEDFSEKASPLKAIIYNFTFAMSPKHKETARNHPIKFSIGMTMHIGVILSILKIPFQINYPSYITTIIILAFFSTLILLINRISSKEMRYMSDFDDYFSNIMTLGLLLVCTLHELLIVTELAMFLYAAIFFLYLPLGKLKHSLFFFVARYDYGKRLGYRGIYQ